MKGGKSMRLEKPLEKFVDEIQIPEVKKPTRKTKTGNYYEVKMTEIKQKLHRDLPETTVWGYDGKYPGPTIDVYKNEAAAVKWINELPEKHLFEINRSYHGAGEENPDVRTVVHLHGGETPADSDGYPDSWYAKDFKVVGPTFTQETYHYPNKQRGATLWYHDHSMGTTRLNVYAGLAGFYLIHDEVEHLLNIPKENYDIPLLIQDRSFNEDGSLLYEQFCDHILVNGKVWPYMEVEPRKYRFRLLNGSNSRTYVMSMDNNQTFYQIASDGGFLERPVELNNLTLAPSERAEIIIDFSKHEGENIIIKNAQAFPPIDPETTANIMQFRVTKPISEVDTTEIPGYMTHIDHYTDEEVQNTRFVTLNETVDDLGQDLMLLNNQRWMDEIKVKPKVNEVEQWNIVNTTAIPHPVHIHLIQFQVVGRRPYDTEHYNETGEVKYTGNLIPPNANECGLKDTIVANPGQVTMVRMKFRPFTGKYVWHCHLLEHEDHEMMLPFEVVDED
jgi:spore coat protein A, manganese oxidase